MTMTISEAQKLQAKLEQGILTLLREFSDETTLSIESIEMTLSSNFADIEVPVDIKIGVRL